METDKMRTNIKSVVGLAACLAFSTQASAANLLTNAGFETGTFAGWVVGGPNQGTGVDVDGAVILGADFGGEKVNVRSGSYAGWGVAGANKNRGQYIELTQTLNIAASSTYNLGFYTGVDSNQLRFGFGNGSFENPGIKVDGIAISVSGLGEINPGDGTGPNPGDMRHVYGTFTSGASQTTVTVSYIITGSGNSAAGWSFDDFEFSAPVPEPETYALMLAGLGMLGLVSRRRNQKHAAT